MNGCHSLLRAVLKKLGTRRWTHLFTGSLYVPLVSGKPGSFNPSLSLSELDGNRKGSSKTEFISEFNGKVQHTNISSTRTKSDRTRFFQRCNAFDLTRKEIGSSWIHELISEWRIMTSAPPAISLISKCRTHLLHWNSPLDYSTLPRLQATLLGRAWCAGVMGLYLNSLCRCSH